MPVRLILLAALVGITICGIGLRAAHATDLSMQDTAFMKKAAQSGHYEIAASMLALSKSQNQQVKDFAQMMLDEHQQIDKELNELAAAKEEVLPVEPSMLQQSQLAMLKAKEGVDFDLYYAQQLGVKAHEKTIELFEEQIKKGDDEEIIGFAQDVLPVLKQHLQHAVLLQQQLEAKP